jgi:hypothetical protein
MAKQLQQLKIEIPGDRRPRRRFHKSLLFLLLAMLLIHDASHSYPFDGYALTGIRRLARLRLIMEGKIKGTMPPPGAQKPLADITLSLLGARGDSLMSLPPEDPALQREIAALFPNRHESYSLALLEITPGKSVRFAQRHADRQLSPGSVGKLVIAAGLFAELKNLFPDSPEQRRQLLRSRSIIADRWIRTDTHEVPIYDPDTGSYAFRIIKEGDVFSLYEWLDHMISASNNSAASTVWKEVLLMRGFGKNYPPTLEQETAFFKETPRSELRDMAMTINEPLRAAGISPSEWQLGSFFTGAGKAIVPGGGGSVANPNGYLKYLIALERGKIVDPWSSLEIKRLLYMTARRIRYASSPALASAKVYYKSGSLYRCKPEPDFVCGKYMGNVENVMNSVAIIEHPDGRVYLVGLMSNVLRKNSAVEHQSLAAFIDRILSK